MKSLVVYASVHHGNTEKVAKAIAEALGGDLMEVKSVDPTLLSKYELVGFGSGIFNGKFHAGLVKLIDEMPSLSSDTFVFSTSGFGWESYNKELKKQLEAKGCKIVGDFACKGWDTNSVFKYFGGINKNRPNAKDLDRAKEFARTHLLTKNP